MKELYNKIALRGIGALTDEELLATLTSNRDLASQILNEVGGLSQLATADLARLRMTAGMGLRLASQIQASTELGRRMAAAGELSATTISSSDDAVKVLSPLLRPLSHEECRVLYLTNANRIIECSCISRGGLQATVVDCRLIIKRALELLSTQIIVAHNHPSGSAEPSEADKNLTRRIREAAALFDIRLLDHIIIASSGEVTSFKSKGLL